MEPNLNQLKYPIGQFEVPRHPTKKLINSWIATINDFPALLRAMVAPLNDRQLDTPYRPKGWTVRQVVHHVGDSHLNSYVRFKWALTEEKPMIKAYFEDRWASLPDSNGDIEPALALLEALHVKWVILLRGLNETDLSRSFIHPENHKEIPLWINIAYYDWH